jgi:hypothetical protein
VWLADPTLFGLIDDTPTQVEHVLAGARSSAELERRGAAVEDGRDVPDLLWNFVEADANGEFELGGLLPRDYSLCAMDPATLVHAELGPFAAGSTDLTLVLHRDDVFPRVAGRVVSGSGRPVAGVRVGTSRTVARVEFQLAHGRQTSARGCPGPSTVTDAEGRFELARIPRKGVELTFGGDAIQPIGHALAADEDVEELEIAVALRCHVQIELRDRRGRADSFHVLDEDGNELSISRFRGEDEYASSSFPLVDGRSEVFALPEGQRTIVLYHGEQEVERHEVALSAGELNWIRW